MIHTNSYSLPSCPGGTSVNHRILKNCIRALFPTDHAMVSVYLMAREMVQTKPTLCYVATDVIAIQRALVEMKHKEIENFDEYLRDMKTEKK